MAGSRIEALLENILGAGNELEEPQSRIEVLLRTLLKRGSHTYIITSGAKDSQTVAAHSRALVEIELDLHEGYEIIAYRNISISKGTGGSGDAHKMVALQYFSTTGGGHKVQIPLINHGDTDAVVRLSANVAADIVVHPEE